MEESPSPVLDETLRRDLARAAAALCQSVAYRNAGTVEFVFDNTERKFYFIEMNTRIQVEHPVSEMVTVSTSSSSSCRSPAACLSHCSRRIPVQRPRHRMPH
ncbi:hypothetical protein [Rhizobium lusitanum]|uniref:ATP-binding protein n=1 Tax=Rhizobium lusitanum TaxID=293958 RepID=UPI003D7C170A